MSGWIETLETDGTPRSRWDEAAGFTLNAPLELPVDEWERQWVSSPWVDGLFATSSSLTGQSLRVHLMVKGVSWPQIEGRTRALVDDVSATHSLLVRVVLDGVTLTWRAYRPDVDAPLGVAAAGLGWRDVSLTFPVLPHPTITGTV